jgi:hypothetical protein
LRVTAQTSRKTVVERVSANQPGELPVVRISNSGKLAIGNVAQ